MSPFLYTAQAHVTGGRADGHGRTSDGALEVDLRTPEEMGGSGGGTNPVVLGITLPSVDDADEADALVRAADQVCPYSNATRGNVAVSLTANGREVREDSEPPTP